MSTPTIPDVSIMATIAIGIASISIVLVFEVMRDIVLLQDKIVGIRLTNKYQERTSPLVHRKNSYNTIFNLLLFVGTISAFVSALICATYFDLIPKKLLNNSIHGLLLCCTITFVWIFYLIFFKTRIES